MILGQHLMSNFVFAFALRNVENGDLVDNLDSWLCKQACWLCHTCPTMKCEERSERRRLPKGFGIT